MDEKEKKPVKRKSNGKNSPVIGNNGLMVEEGDNRKFLAVSLEVMNLPDIRVRNCTVEQVDERIAEYFAIYDRHDIKPTVSGLAMALGMDRRTLWAIANDQPVNGQGHPNTLPAPISNSIKKAYKIMETLWENYSQNGKMNPVTSIFLAKNNYGYVDKVEHVVTPNVQSDSDYDAEDIKKRYLTDSTTMVIDSEAIDSSDS